MNMTQLERELIGVLKLALPYINVKDINDPDGPCRAVVDAIAKAEAAQDREIPAECGRVVQVKP
jgi:hypothetical protein